MDEIERITKRSRNVNQQLPASAVGEHDRSHGYQSGEQDEDGADDAAEYLTGNN
jgi:hypothetical protein